MSATQRRKLFFGENVSTGGTSATLISSEEILWEGAVPHKGALAAKYGLLEGFFRLGPGDYYVPPYLLVEAHEGILEKLRDEMGREVVAEIRGKRTAAQQHGTCWMSEIAESILDGLNGDRPVVDQIEGLLALPFCPMWMNSATAPECKELLHKKDAEWWARNSGSVPTRRFPLAQTLQKSRMYPGNWKKTAQVVLINGLITSIDAGTLSPWDTGEGLASNAGSIRTRQLLRTAVGYVPGLRSRLAELHEPDFVVWRAARWLQERIGFAPDCDIYVGGGDNNWSIVGSGVTEPGEEVWSIGTSITRLKILAGVPRVANLLAHVMAAGSGRLMRMYCMSNGCRSFEHQCKLSGNIALSEFDRLVAETDYRKALPMVPFLVTESVPVKDPRWEYSDGMQPNDPAAPLAVVQALIGNMILAGGEEDSAVDSIIATGGGASDQVCQVLADMTGATVRKGRKDTVSLGAAIGAAHYSTDIPWKELTGSLCKTTGVFTPRPGRTEYYRTEYLPKLRQLINGG